MPQTPVNKLDFAEIKSNLLTFLKGQERYKDYNFEGSNMNVLLDVLSYNTFYNQYYNNMALSEMFLDSAQLRNSAISHAKELNYVPQSKRAAAAIVNLTVRSGQASNFFNIPKFTRFNAKCGDRTFSFVNIESTFATRVDAQRFVINNLKVYEGRVVEELTNTSDLMIKSASVDTTTIEVFVNGQSYTFVKDIFGVNANDKVFYVQAEVDGYYSIYFGENVIGNQPDADAEIKIRYIITSGEEANGITSINIGNRYLNGASSIVTELVQSSSGGRPRETLESIKMFAPRAFQIQERAVTRQDYATLLQQRFPRIQAISVFGGDEIEPPQYGSVVISVDVAGAQGASDSEIGAFEEYLSDKTPLTIQPIFVAPKFIFVDFDAQITYNKKLTALNPEELRQLIFTAVENYAETNINGFNSAYLQSKVVKTILDVDESVGGVDITATPYIQYNPILNLPDSPKFDFGNELQKPYVFNETIGFANYEPAIYSSIFVIDGINATLQDDGNGNLLAVTVNVPTKSILKRNIGTVDYVSGVVRLSNFETSSYEGSSIKIYARTKSKNVYSQQDRILELRKSDFKVTVTPMSTITSTTGYATIGSQTTTPVYNVSNSANASGSGE